MTYNPTNWKDQIVTNPTKYKITKENGTEEVVDIERTPGEIIQEGTRITADKLNNIEQGIKGAADLVNDLAGVGRTDETVKGNAEDIGFVSTQMAELASNELGKGSSKVGIHDADGNFTATDVEGALKELFTNVSNGKNVLETSITDMNGEVSKINDIPTFAELKDGILGIPTGGLVKNVQRGVVTLSDTLTTIDISNVDLSKSFLIISNSSSNTDSSYGDARSTVRGMFAGNSQITLERSSSAYGAIISWEVIEFVGGVSVQSVSGTMPSYPTNIVNQTISTVNMNKAFLVLSYSAVSSSQIARTNFLRANLTSSTNVQIYVDYGSAIKYNCFVVEFL